MRVENACRTEKRRCGPHSPKNEGVTLIPPSLTLIPPSRFFPGYRRPVVIVQSNEFNESRIQTLIVAAITSNLSLGEAPGNVVIPRRRAGLPRKSVVNISQLLTVSKSLLTERIGRFDESLSHRLDQGLRLVLAL
ncbi:MAG: type II toxin-antitoxin system PemK/MazF family toxin [Acidobacteria bacterium]|nr:type II toxin-antitoxin system PemK/MazF family toxin [Acidobacteriota bacterium]